MNPSGLIKGDDVRNAIIGPQGRAAVSIETITAMVPQAQKGVNAPKATLPVIDTPAFFISIFLSFSGSAYTFTAAAVSMPKARTGALWSNVPAT